MKRPHFKKMVILGVGLLGGSIGLGARKRRLAKQVWGYDSRSNQAKAALRRGLLTHVAESLEEACFQADLIVLATPFTLFESMLKKISKLAPSDCLVTDVGSVKGAWVSRWERAAKPLCYVGAHPMAGSEKNGWEHARKDLFEGAPCILTPTRSTSKASIDSIRSFWSALGCRLHQCSASEHDRLIGRFSHLTHALAFALSKGAGRGLKPTDYQIAGPSFWSNTRIAASNPELWADIFEYNHEVLEREIEVAILELRRLLRLKGKALYTELASISVQAAKVRP